MNPKCPICVKEGKSFFKSQLPCSVRSDWTPVELYLCGNCDHLFKKDSLVKKGSDYESYVIWNNSSVGDKVVYQSGNPTVGRSKKVHEFLQSYVDNLEDLNILDFGCNRGAFLALFENHKGTLTGLDISENYRANVEGLGCQYFTDYEKLNGNYNVISLIHVLEHFVDFRKELVGAVSNMNKGGNLLIQVPNIISQPTDAYIIDHKHHFSKHSLIKMFSEIFNYSTEYIDELVPGELTSIHSTRQKKKDCNKEDFSILQNSLKKSESIIILLLENCEQNIAIYGAGMTGTFYGNILGERVSYFIDDDPNTHGSKILGKSVYSFQCRPTQVTILNAVPGPNSKTVYNKRKADCEMINLF